MNNASKVIVFAMLLSSLSCYSMYQAAVVAANRKKGTSKSVAKKVKKGSSFGQSNHAHAVSNGFAAIPVGK